MSRHLATVFTLAVSLGLPATGHAQDPGRDRQEGEPPGTIDILAPPVTDEPELDPDCAKQQEASILSGEIVVCAKRTGGENRLYDKEAAERRHAERTQGAKPVDVAGPGIFRGKPTIGGMCFIPPCPKDPAYMIDFEELPDTPAGSDADRMARGLAPRGYDRKLDGATVIAEEPGLQANAEELGLPPPLAEEGEELSPSGSASPEEPQ
ncbi:hypothetical protein [Qipengyuania gelatinilytica]|uniref:Uncharacterized protein n=1 Tax=Qipengyuania gelatinilytica TaxID=2867231 RepID=A0ABX8ZZ24_9SPHN|nr:hypothetical protein [Qipengyuania gelatinilytica]QZD94275.1 hypothetical protein K3136_09225 [Qipengyuania gelatinilytica]